MVRKAVADKTWVALSDFLFDWVHRLIFRNYHLCIRPTRDLNDHVENAPIVIGKRDTMEWRDNMAVLFDEYTVF